MAHVADGGAEIRLDKEDREALGREFKQWIERVEDERRERMQKIYVQAEANLEGKVPTKQFPWPGASNAHLPVTGTHTTAIKARLSAAATNQTPTFLILPQAGGFLMKASVDGQEMEVTYELWSRWWQNISKWAEDQVDKKKIMGDVIMNFIGFGDTWLYNPWETQEVMDASIDLDAGEEGEVVLTPRQLWDQPKPRAIHPKDSYIEWSERSTQEATKVGFAWDLTLPQLLEYKASGFYSKEVAEELEELLTAQSQDRIDDMKAALGGSETVKEWTARELDEFEMSQADHVGVTGAPHALRMITVFARADLDNDGIPEEIIFHVEKSKGLVPYARYANYLHRERPLIHFFYDERAGSIYHKGVPELLFNLQKIMDTTIRDHLDNNKIQNTKMFLARKGGPIKEDARVYPSRIFYVDNTDPRSGDLVPLDLGTGRPVTGIQDIGLLEQHAQFITGITDFNLGQEKRSRTPATTTLSLIEESNQRRDEVIEMMRNAMLQWWRQVLMMYFQNGDPEKLAKVAVTTSGGPERTEEVIQGINPEEEKKLFIAAWNAADPNELMEQISLKAEVSSNAFNRATQRQEALALFAQFDAFVMKMIELANLIGGSLADPHMRNLLLFFVKGYRRAMSKVLDTMDIKDQEVFNPQTLEDLIKEVNSVPIDGAAGAPGATGSTPAGQAQGLAAQGDGVTNPGEAPNRPVAGAPRANGELGSPIG